MTTFYFILQGEITKPDGEWGGFYASRWVEADTEAAASEAVLQRCRQDWACGTSTHLGRLDYCKVICAWKRPLLAWRKGPNEGHCFYNNDADAQWISLKMECKVARTPLHIRWKLFKALK